MPPINFQTVRPQRVFISYAQADKLVARQIAGALQHAGISVWFDEWALSIGDSILQKIENALQASDILLVLLSPHSVESHWIAAELNAALLSELRTRAVTVMPALIADCEIPSKLATRQYLDLRTNLEEGIQKLIQQLGNAPAVDFTRLNGQSFENLIADLLLDLGFAVERQLTSRDSGYDFIATFVSDDPFGTERRESWLVQTKFYANQRVSVQALRQIFGYMATLSGFHKGLVVTSGQLTSVALEFLNEITQKSGKELRVIDGTELRALLLRSPKLVAQYFGTGIKA